MRDRWFVNALENAGVKPEELYKKKLLAHAIPTKVLERRAKIALRHDQRTLLEAKEVIERRFSSVTTSDTGVAGDPTHKVADILRDLAELIGEKSV